MKKENINLWTIDEKIDFSNKKIRNAKVIMFSGMALVPASIGTMVTSGNLKVTALMATSSFLFMALGHHELSDWKAMACVLSEEKESFVKKMK